MASAPLLTDLLKKFDPIIPNVATFGYLALGWTVLGHASTAQFGLGILDTSNEWIAAHFGVSLLIGFGLLLFAVAWPELRGRIRLFPPSVNERLLHLEGTHLPRETFTKHVEEVHQALADRFAKVEELVLGTDGGLSVAGLREKAHYLQKKGTDDLYKIQGDLAPLTSMKAAIGEQEQRIRKLEIGPEPGN